MTKILVSIPCRNEEDNVVPMAEGIIELFNTSFPQYGFSIQFIDNDSSDTTQERILMLCEKYPDRVRAIFNARNFPTTSGYYGLINTISDCTITIPCDFQVPINSIKDMISAWESGAKIVCMIKKNSNENKLMWLVRQIFYKLANAFSDSEILRNFAGAGLFDRTFVELFRQCGDKTVPLIQLIVEYGYDIVKIPYTHEKRRSGKSKHTLTSLIDFAIRRFVTASSVGPRTATYLGVVLALLSFLIGLVYLILKLIYWHTFEAGIAPLVVGFFFFSAIQLFFLGLTGEYVINLRKRLEKGPLVIERKRVNFRDEDE